MLRTRVVRLLVAGLVLASVTALSGCGGKKPAQQPVSMPSVEALPTAASSPSASPSASPSPSRSPSASRKPTPKPSSTLKKQVAAGGDTGGATKPPSPGADGVPQSGAGTFTVASGGTAVVGTGVTLVKYRAEVEDGIQWGTNTVWTPAKFAAAVEQAIGSPRGWTFSAEHPVTYPSNKLADASWSFQRVDGADYSVRLRLATPDTVDKLCKAVGVDTQGIYSCRYGQTILVNLRRWLKGIAGFPPDIEYHDMTINHEMGHFLGFDHMKCPAPGQVAPVMQTQTIALNGCTPNAFPFAADGTFIQGPWAPS